MAPGITAACGDITGCIDSDYSHLDVSAKDGCKERVDAYFAGMGWEPPDPLAGVGSFSVACEQCPATTVLKHTGGGNRCTKLVEAPACKKTPFSPETLFYFIGRVGISAGFLCVGTGQDRCDLAVQDLDASGIPAGAGAGAGAGTGAVGLGLGIRSPKTNGGEKKRCA